MNSSYGLLVSFPDQSETFVLGFEAGQCWQRLEAGNADDVTMHAANQEVFRRIARNYAYDVEFEPASEGWSVARFSRGRPKLHSVG
jgi:hypothetical protein